MRAHPGWHTAGSHTRALRRNVEAAQLPLTEVLGRPVLTANDLARLVDREAGSGDEQFTLIAFLDGEPESGQAVERGLEAFRASWHRPKWPVPEEEGWGAVVAAGVEGGEGR